MAQKEDEHRVIGGTAIEKKKKSKTTEENGAIKMKGNRNDNINEEGEQRGPEEGGRDTGEEEITKKKKKKKSKTTEENGAIKMKGNRNDNINEEGEQRGPEEGGRDTGEQEITKKKKKKKKVNQEYGHSPDTEEGGQEMRKMVVKTTGTEPVEDRDEEENPKLKKKKKKHKSDESEEIQQHPVKAVKQKQAGAEKRKKKRKHKEMEQEEGGGVEVEEEKGVCAKKKKRVNDGRGRQEDGGVIEPEGSKEKQLKKRKKRLVEQEEGTEEGKKKQKGLPSKTVSPHQEMPNKQIDKKKKMKKYLCSEETEGVEKEEMGTVTKKKGKKRAKLDAIQEGDDVEREDGDGGSLKKKQKKKKVMEEVKLLTAMEKNNKGVKVKIKIEDEYSGNKPEFEIVSVKPGNTDEVNIDKERRRALQEEIDRESCPPPHDPSQVTGASFGQWGTATFGNVDRQNKFLRLMGGFKKSGQSMVPEGGVKAERPNMALNQADQDQLTRGLQGEFDRAQNRRLHPQQKGVGLGFQSAPSKSRIDREASKSIKFED